MLKFYPKITPGRWWLFLLFLSSCTAVDKPAEVQQQGYRPVYIVREVMEKIRIDAPQPLKNPGKIYVQGTYLFVNEINLGIHIIDNQQPTAPSENCFSEHSRQRGHGRKR